MASLQINGVCERLMLMSSEQITAISWHELVTFQRNDNEVRFVLDQYDHM
jgi:hypothetical protein